MASYRILLSRLSTKNYQIVLYNGDWDDVVPYHDTVKAFDTGNMQAALDNFFLAIHSRYDIEKPSVIRYIRKKLNIINELKKQNDVLTENIKKRDKFLMKLAAEYVIMAKECEAANMKEAAIKNYQKALELYPSLSEAKKKMNKLMKE